MLAFRRILTCLFLGAFIMVQTPRPAEATGIPAIDVGALSQGIKRAGTDVQNAKQLSFAAKTAKSIQGALGKFNDCLLYTSPSPRDP